MKTYTCQYCNKEFESRQSCNGHVGACSLNPKLNSEFIECKWCNEIYSKKENRTHRKKCKKFLRSEDTTQKEKIHQCKYCKKIFESYRQLAPHVSHCKLSPNYEINKQNRKNHHPWKGKHHSNESKNKISLSRTRYLQNNPSSFNPHKESYPEKIFRESLEKNNIKGWVQEYRAGIYSYDFAFPELGIDVEIDGRTHLDSQIIEKDRIRDNYTLSLGWKILRFPALNVIKNHEECIKILLKFIDDTKTKIFKQEVFPQIILQKEEKEKIIQQNKIDMIEERNQLIEFRKNLILNSNIDFFNIGWVEDVKKILNLTHTTVVKFMKKYMSEFYNTKCFKRRGPRTTGEVRTRMISN